MRISNSSVLALGCGAPRPVPAPPRAAPPLELPAAVLPLHGTLMIGDLHGTREIPAFVGRLVAMVATREPVVLALEIPPQQVPSLEAFLASDGSPEMRGRLVADSWWQCPFQDGRRSVAMADLLEAMRALRAAGRRVTVVAIDSDAEGDREEAMADNVIAARRRHPDAALIVYAGNLHTSKVESPWDPGFVWMAMRVARAGIAFVSLNARWPDGTAWICCDSIAEHCGVAFLAGRDIAPGIHVEPLDGGAYDGWFGLDTVTASPPAGIAEMAKGIDAKIAAAGSSLAGRKDDAFVKLQYAIGAGFDDMAHLEADEDLATLRSDPRWPVKK